MPKFLKGTELEAVIGRLQNYPAGRGAAWGVMPDKVLTPCHLTCFVPRYDDVLVSHLFRGEINAQPAALGDPAVALADLRGELDRRGIIRAYEDIKATYGDRPYHRYTDALDQDPRAVAEYFRGLAKKDDAGAVAA